ncbi:hypothetical protein [Nonomuraea sp. NPDC050643]|uniref:hypothetical protein n=1 Tax=Nonomuraea sp. NPDC050643 TaxID=3155660 RepID=UPI0034030F5E
MTVIKDTAGRYFASFVVGVDEVILPEADAETGIDLGLAHFVVLSAAGRSARRSFCGARLHRAGLDVNAAINILAAGRAERLNACGGQTRPPCAVVQANEAESRGSAAA